ARAARAPPGPPLRPPAPQHRRVLAGPAGAGPPPVSAPHAGLRRRRARARAASARRSLPSRTTTTAPNAAVAARQASAATPAFGRKPAAGSAADTSAPAAAPARAPASPAAAARGDPRRAAGPRTTRTAASGASPASVMPTVLPSASTGTPHRGPTAGTATTSVTITASQPDTSAIAATRLRSHANSTREAFAARP